MVNIDATSIYWGSMASRGFAMVDRSHRVVTARTTATLVKLRRKMPAQPAPRPLFGTTLGPCSVGQH